MEKRAGKKYKKHKYMNIGGNRSRVDKRQVGPSQRQGGRKSGGNSKSNVDNVDNVDV